MRSKAWWSWKSRVFSAIANCPKQESETPPTVNVDGDHREKTEEGCQNNTMFSVKIS